MDKVDLGVDLLNDINYISLYIIDWISSLPTLNFFGTCCLTPCDLRICITIILLLGQCHRKCLVKLIC